MEKRTFTLILIVVVVAIIGVGLIKRQASNPALSKILKQQKILLDAQKRIETKLGTGPGAGKDRRDRTSDLLQKQQDLENRLTSLENQWKGLQESLKQIGGQGNARQAPPPEDLSKIYDIAVAHSPVRGNKNAPVTIVEFVDFQCPFCARFHPPIAETLKAYPDDVNYVLKNFPLPFHAMGKPASKAAFAAGEQGKYWEMADALLENGASLSEPKIEEIAKGLGLNMKRFQDDYKNKDEQWEEYIQKDMALGQQVNTRGTPTFYINGKKTSARDFNSFKSEIDEILENLK